MRAGARALSQKTRKNGTPIPTHDRYFSTTMGTKGHKRSQRIVNRAALVWSGCGDAAHQVLLFGFVFGADGEGVEDAK